MEQLNDIYLELLTWLEYEGKPSARIWHPLFYTYPWGLRFELGNPALTEKESYIQCAVERGQRIWLEVFEPEDEVLVIFDTTPERDLKQELKSCQTQRLRTKYLPAWPGDEGEYEERYFYRYLYTGKACEIPFPFILEKIVKGELFADAKVYSSAVYFYNRTKKLLYHPYDDRGADLIGPDRETLRPFYIGLNDILLSWNREDMEKKWKYRPVYLRILTTSTAPRTDKYLRLILQQKLWDASLTFSALLPYWKFDGWGELNVTAETPKSLESIQSRLASHWESNCSSEGIRLPDVGFISVSE